MHDLLFTQQDRLTDAALRGYAEQLGMDGDRVVGEPAQPFGDQVEADFAAGLAAGVAGTPTLFIDGGRYAGRVELGALRRAVATPPDPASGAEGARQGAAAATVVPRPPACTAGTARRGPAAGSTPRTAAVTDPAEDADRRLFARGARRRTPGR